MLEHSQRRQLLWHPVDSDSLAHASLFRLALTGTVFGLVHILTGPDHLSALAALSCGSSWNAFILGARWGCGHSIGLVFMAVIFIVLDGKFDFTIANIYTDIVVGVFMIILGVYGVRSACRKRPGESIQNSVCHSIDMLSVKRNSVKEVNGRGLEVTNGTKYEHIFEEHNDSADFELNNSSRNVDSDGEAACQSVTNHSVTLSVGKKDVNLDQECLLVRKDSGSGSAFCDWMRRFDWKDQNTQKFAALIVGIVHGIAGPGGILGVLPAVGLHDVLKTVTYLGAFCLSSILIMGLFAGLFGEITARLGKRSEIWAIRLAVTSSLLSVCIGVVWIALAILG